MLHVIKKQLKIHYKIEKKEVLEIKQRISFFTKE